VSAPAIMKFIDTNHDPWHEATADDSLVAVPANPKALAVGRALGVSSHVLERALPDAVVIEQQRALASALLAAQLRGLRLYGPR